MTDAEKIKVIESNLGIADLRINKWSMAGSFLNPTTIKAEFRISATGAKAAVTASDMDDLIFRIRKVVSREISELGRFNSVQPSYFSGEGPPSFKPVYDQSSNLAFYADNLTGDQWCAERGCEWRLVVKKVPAVPEFKGIPKWYTKPKASTKSTKPLNPWGRKLIL